MATKKPAVKKAAAKTKRVRMIAAKVSAFVSPRYQIIDPKTGAVIASCADRGDAVCAGQSLAELKKRAMKLVDTAK